MKRRFKVLLSTLAIGAISLFGVFGASCGAVDWVEEKFDQLTCAHETTDVIAAVEATCLEDGHSEYEVCIDCGWEVVAKKVEKATGHKTKVVKGRAATCTVMGISDGAVCEVCGEITVEQKNTPALGHHKVELKAVAPTCTQTGLTAGIACDNEGCGKVFVAQEVVDVVEHRYYNNICRVCSALEVLPDTLSMTEVEVNVGDRIGGGYYRLYGVDAKNGESGLIVVQNNNGVGFGLYVSLFTAIAVDKDYNWTEIYAPATTSIIVLNDDYAYNTEGEMFIDLYIPSYVSEVWSNGDKTLQVYVDNTSVLLAYVEDMSADGSLVHKSGGLYKLV